MSSSRRHFAAALSLAPAIFASNKSDPMHGRLLGHGPFRYRVDKKWSQADPVALPVRDCHEMVQSADGRLFLLTNHAANNVLIYDTGGRVAGHWTLDFKGAHGLSLHREPSGEEFLFITDIGTGRVVKTNLAGQIQLELPHAQKCGAYGAQDVYSPTETAVAPSGDIYVADGYGSQWILRFDKTGKFLNKFGGRSSQPISKGKFLQAHGVAIDARGAEPLVVCTARIRNEFHWFTLAGEFVKTVYLPGAYLSRPVIAGRYLYSGICFGMFENDFRMWQGRGFVTILDDQDRVVSNPGGTPPRYKNGKLGLMLQDQPVFHNCHDVCVDRQGDLYVCQWNSGQVYPYKLHREA
jgi:peptidylamidoglycolate lyase